MSSCNSAEPLKEAQNPQVEPQPQKSITLLRTAMQHVVGEERSEAFFKDWSERTIRFFFRQERRLHQVFQNRTVPSVDNLFVSHSDSFVANMGEARAHSELVLEAQRLNDPNVFVFDEIEYRFLNPDGKKPDGILFHFDGHQLTILRVAESKVGTSGFDAGQAKGILSQWKVNGMKIPQSPTPISPENILVRLGDTSKPIREITDQEFESIYHLIATREHPVFPGRVTLLEVSPSELFEVAYKYISLLREINPTIPTTPTHSNFVLPKLEGESLDHFRQLLSAWVIEHRTYPKAGTLNDFEKFLGREISSLGGQGNLFVSYLTEEAQEVLVETDNFPALSPWIHRLSQQDPNLDRNKTTFQLALRCYPDKANAIKKDLAARSIAWKLFFSKTLATDGGCAGQISGIENPE